MIKAVHSRTPAESGSRCSEGDLVPNTELPAGRRTMFRISLIVCVSLIFGVTAKPWNKLSDEVFQKAVMSIDERGKPSWAVAVEPPEDMDRTHYDIDPNMKIWKSMRGSGQEKKYLKAEEDLDELYHPSTDNLLRGHNQNLDVPPVLLAEQLIPQMAVKSQARVHLEPEEDMDAVYHKEPVRAVFHQDNIRAAYPVNFPPQKKHTQPEEDLDKIYHR